MKKFTTLAAVALLASGHTPAVAAPAKAPPKATPKAPAAAVPLTKDQMDHAVQVFGVMSSALRSDKVPDDVKSALMSCIYSVSLGEISSHVDQLIAANPGKIDRNDPDKLLSAMAAICGYRPSEAPAAAPPAGEAPKGAAVGR